MKIEDRTGRKPVRAGRSAGESDCTVCLEGKKCMSEAVAPRRNPHRGQPEGPDKKGRRNKEEPADKPGSVADNHSSGTTVTGSLKQPTRKHRGPRHCFPIWSCSRWGLPCRSVLPPARCALTAPFHPYHHHVETIRGGIFSVALSVGSRPPGVTWHPALWSPDFPPRGSANAATKRLPGRLPQPFSPTRARIHRKRKRAQAWSNAE